ncbi:sodium:proton antiporter, partial [Shewanella sp. 0m-11]
NHGETSSARHQLSESYLKRLCLFGEGVSYSKLASLMAKGASIKSTSLTESFNYAMFMAQYGQAAIPLIYLQDGKVRVISAALDTELLTGVELISLIPVDAIKLEMSSEQPDKVGTS